MDAAIKALDPYDEATYRKYFETSQKLDYFNWQPCADDKELMEVAGKISTMWISFWTQKDVDKIVEKNMKKNWKTITELVPSIQNNWNGKNYDKAGLDFVHLYQAIMDRE